MNYLSSTSLVGGVFLALDQKIGLKLGVEGNGAYDMVLSTVSKYNQLPLIRNKTGSNKFKGLPLSLDGRKLKWSGRRSLSI